MGQAIRAAAPEPPATALHHQWLLRPIAFFVGAASLGAEIAAARLLAPYFGASTIIWANTIATVLVALSVGYCDRRPARRPPAAICAACARSCW